MTKPEGHVHFRKKLLWTFTALFAYFVLSNVLIYGLSEESLDAFAAFRAILAGESGSLVHMGIMPIVTASIIMQLFSGAKIIKLDLQNPEDKSIYQGTQKMLVVVMIFVEAIPQVFGFLEPSAGLIQDHGMGLARAAIIGQIAVGSYLVFLMDETVSKWGVGSGISLFIVASVSQSLFTGFLSWIPSDGRGSEYGLQNPPAGVVPKTFYLINQMSTGQLVNQGGFEQILFAPPNPIIALLATVLVFVVVVYAESSRVELPLSHGKVRGARGRYPIRLLYASVIPVILAGALLANINLLGLLLYTGPLQELPLLGHSWLAVNAPQFAGFFGTYMAGTTTPVSGIAYYFSLVNGVSDWLLPLLGSQYGFVSVYRAPWQIVLHILAYSVFMIGGAILFAIFWIETTNMGPQRVAQQIQSSGMQIPGFRRDPRITGKILERYIPVVTVISGAAVGCLAVFGDLLGTLGQASGTGVLLAVGILHRLYEQIAKEQAMEMHPMLRDFFGQS